MEKFYLSLFIGFLVPIMLWLVRISWVAVIAALKEIETIPWRFFVLGWGFWSLVAYFWWIPQFLSNH